jgi:hypothetical protein
MKISTRIKQVLSITLVSVLAATVMPSAVSAEEEYSYDDSVVTVDVDLGDGPGDEVGCVGVATLELPDNTLRARFDARTSPGNPVADLLFYEYDSEYSDREYTNDDLSDFLDELSNQYRSPVTNPSEATVENLVSITYDTTPTEPDALEENTVDSFNYADDNEDGVIDVRDAPDFLTEVRRTYSTISFPVSYDASDCVDSEEVGLLLATRGPMKKLIDVIEDEWEIVEVEDDPISSVVDRGSAYLKLDTNLLGGLISLPVKVAQDPEVVGDGELGSAEDIYDYWDPIAFGDEGTAEMKAVFSIFGDSPTGKYQTKFYYQLQVDEESYFENLIFLAYLFGGP